MMWIFEWDIVTGDSAALDSIYEVSRDDLDSAIADGAGAAEVSAGMREQVAATSPDAWHSPELLPVVRRRARLRDGPAGHARRVPRDRAAARAVARHGQRDRARPVAGRRAGVPRGARRARGAVRGRPRPARVQLHRRRPRQRPRRPRPRDGVARPRRCSSRSSSCWCSGSRRARFPGAAALRALVVAATRPWRLGEVPAPTTRADRVLVWALPAVVLVASRCVLHVVRGARAPRRHARRLAGARRRAALGGARPGPVPPVGGARRGGAAAHGDPARRARGPRSGALLVRLLDRPRRAHGVRHRGVRGVLLAVRRRRARAPARLRAGHRPVPRRDARWPAGLRSRSWPAVSRPSGSRRR